MPFNAATACGGLDAANDVCRGGDTVIVRGGTYTSGGRETVITGTNGRGDYCNFYSATGETAVLGGCNGNNPALQADSMCLDVMGDSGWLRLDGGANNGFTTPAFSGQGIDLGVTTWYGHFDTERGCTHVTFTRVHVGSVNIICPSSEVSNSELGPSIDNNSKFFTAANPVLIEGNRIHHYDRDSVDQHMECLYFVGTVNLTFRGNTVGPCDVIGIHAKEYPPFTNNTIENNIFLPGANGIEYRYAPCTNLLVRNNIIADGLLDDGCSPSTVTGNIFLTGDSGGCTGWSYNIFVGSVCGANSFSSTLAALFVDPANRNYHTRAGSPGIDAANPGTFPLHDIEQDPRPQGPRPDAGAYEAG